MTFQEALLAIWDKPDKEARPCLSSFDDYIYYHPLHGYEWNSGAIAKIPHKLLIEADWEVRDR